MSDRIKPELDALEKRLTGPKRVGLFGHRAVGKTTLLAMAYREASTGGVPGIRLSAGDPASAEYLAEKIAGIEAGESPAGTLAETPLRLRLYRGIARLDLVVKDYQGEHVGLGVEAPIRDFFDDCDAVLLCLDPEGSPDATSRRRRQQEIEDLFERFLDRGVDGTAGRPVALLITKYDRVIESGGPPSEDVDRFVESAYGMTRHALALHVPRSAIFAVSSYGPAAGPDGSPPARIEPIGLAGPLIWLAEQLEAIDIEGLEWLWDLAPNDLPRLARCVKAFEKRYPRSDRAIDFRRRIDRLRRRRAYRRVAATVVLLGLGVGSVAGYDAWGYRDALKFERGPRPPAAIECNWERLLANHPTLPYFFPSDAERARRHLIEWRVKAAGALVDAGDASPEVSEGVRDLKEQAPDLAPQIERIEQAGRLAEQDRRWESLRVADLLAIEDPAAHLAEVREYLRTYPDTPHREAAVELAKGLEALAEDEQATLDRREIDAIVRSAMLPDTPIRDLIERAEVFLSNRPGSRYKSEIEELLKSYLQRLDETDIARAREFSKSSPTNFAVRRERYLDYLKAHADGGQFVSEANAAIAAIEHDRDMYLYRQAYDHHVAHPDDVPTIAARLRAYLEANPEGLYSESARDYVSWWEKISAPADYRVVLRRGRVDSGVGKWLSGAGPDLSVTFWVGGVEYGPSPTMKDTRRPIWDWPAPRPVRWKYGDPVTVRIVDHDWSDSGVYTLKTPPGEKLAMKMLSGTLKPSKGGTTELVFTSDFRIPQLPKPQ